MVIGKFLTQGINMELVGFINEHNPSFSKTYSDFRKQFNVESKQEILSYLKKGIPIATTTQLISSLINDNQTILGGIVYLTDGNWIWPNYLSHYVEHDSIELPRQFLEHIFNNKSEIFVNTENRNQAILILKNTNIL